MSQTQKRTPVIIDTDPGVDDIVAILLALASPELDVKAIIITFGNTDVDAAYLNILRLLKALTLQFKSDPQSAARFPNLSPHTKIILAKGTNGPLEGDLHSAQYFHGRDGLGEMDKRHPDLNVDTMDPEAYPNLEFSNKPGVEVALDIIISETPRSLTYIALGPLTTFAQLIRQHGDVVSKRLGQVVCMGGNLDVPGNTSAVAEFNFFADPFAVKELLEPSPSGEPFPLNRFLLLPLDVTTPHEIPFPHYLAHVDPAFQDTSQPSTAAGKAPLVHFTSSFLERTREVMLLFGKDAMELHDVVAVWCAVENPPVAEGEEGPVLGGRWRAVRRHFQVERYGEITRGMLVVDRREDEGAYDPGANRAAVQAELEKNMFAAGGVLESNAVPAQIEVETPPAVPKQKATGGVPVVTATPGPALLLDLLFTRVWGVTVA